MRSDSSKNQLLWEWVFDDASTSRPILLCIYDAHRLVTTATIPAGRMTTTSFEYSRRGPRSGSVSAQLRTTVSPDEIRIQLRASGPRLAGAGSPLGDTASPVTVQLMSATGTCFGAVYSAPVRTRDGRSPRDQGD